MVARMLQRERLHVAGGRVDWYVHCANQYGGSSKLSKWNLQKLQPHYWLVFPADAKSAHLCLLQLYSD